MKKDYVAFLLFALFPLLCGAATYANGINNLAPKINAKVSACYITPDGDHIYLATSEGIKIGKRSTQKNWSWKSITKKQGLPDNNIDSLAIAKDKQGNMTALFAASANTASKKGGISKVKPDGSGIYWTIGCTRKLGGITLSLTQDKKGLPMVLFAETGEGIIKLSNLTQNYTPATIKWINTDLTDYSTLVSYDHTTGIPVKLYVIKTDDNLLYDINPVSPADRHYIPTIETKDRNSIIFGFFQSIMSEMFRLNKECQEQGYYMGEFEFKMLGITEWIDHGQYVKAVTKLYQYYRQLKTKKGLIKVPQFGDTKEDKRKEYMFYRSLQNPKTGAFMDDTYPYSQFSGPTDNVLNLLNELAKETDQQFTLQYQLKFLDQINTRENMINYLNYVSTVNPIVIRLKFAQTTFSNARFTLELFYNDDFLDKLYNMPLETKKAILEWFEEKQDPASGLWGPMDKEGNIVKQDTENSASIVKTFVDKDGNDRFIDFPLHHRDKLAATFSKVVSNLLNKLPKGQDLEQWHEWNLNVSKSMGTITRYLWVKLTKESKQNIQDVIKKYITLKFQSFYVKEDNGEGAFSYYPASEKASLDGSSFIHDLQDYGYCSSSNQTRLWHPSIEKKEYNISNFTKTDFHKELEGFNSIRFYAVEPQTTNCIDNVAGVFYPHKTNILDAMELIPRMQLWLDDPKTQKMGNWTSKANIQKALNETKIPLKPVPNISQQNLPVEELNNILQKNKKLILIGFDTLQIPRVKIIYNRI